MLLADAGGFNGAVIIIPGYLMSFYTEGMLKTSFVAKTPVALRQTSSREGRADFLE